MNMRRRAQPGAVGYELSLCVSWNFLRITFQMRFGNKIAAYKIVT